MPLVTLVPGALEDRGGLTPPQLLRGEVKFVRPPQSNFSESVRGSRVITGKDKKGKRKTSTQPAIRAAFGGK